MDRMELITRERSFNRPRPPAFHALSSWTDTKEEEEDHEKTPFLTISSTSIGLALITQGSSLKTMSQCGNDNDGGINEGTGFHMNPEEVLVGRRKSATVCRPPLRLLRVMAIWRARFAVNRTGGLMDALSYPWRKIGVVARSAPVLEEEIKAACPPMPSLVEACEQCHEDVVRYLLRKGISKAELNARDKTGKTGLSHACCNGFVSIVNILRLPEIDVTLADNEGNHPLIFAAQAGHADIVSILINYFPSLNLDQQNKQGFTALMKAAVQGRARCAKLLLYAGATPFARDYGRRLCALEWAEYCGRHTTAKVIAQFMEACNLGLICSTVLANSRPAQNQNQNQSRHHSTVHQLDVFSTNPTFHRGWRSESCITGSDTTDNPNVGCMPFQLLQRVRRSLPNSSADSAFSPLHSLEEIAKLCYSPVFPEYVSPPNSRKGSSNGSKRSHVIIPKVEITMTSKDDNYFYETPLPFVRSPSTYRKYLENLENCHVSSSDKGV